MTSAAAPNRRFERELRYPRACPFDAVGVIALARLAESLYGEPIGWSEHLTGERVDGSGAEALELVVNGLDREPVGIAIYQFAARSLVIGFFAWPRGSVSGPDETWVVGTAARLQEEMDGRFRTPFFWRVDVERVIWVLAVVVSLSLLGIWLVFGQVARPLSGGEIALFALGFGYVGFLVATVLLAAIRRGINPRHPVRLVRRPMPRAWYDHPLTRTLLAIGGLLALGLLIWRQILAASGQGTP